MSAMGEILKQVNETWKHEQVLEFSRSTKFYRTVTQHVSIDGLWIELGVAAGRSAVHLAPLAQERNQILYGADSFYGLPEFWRTIGKKKFDKGCYTSIHNVPNIQNAVWIKGMFDRTLPKFSQEHPEPIAFLHVDCDLYSSTKTALDILGDQIVPGTIILFDEFWPGKHDKYPEWIDHEAKAWAEFVDEKKIEYEWLYRMKETTQVVVKVLNTGT